MDADLLVVGLGQDLTKIALQGTYEAPMGAVGASLDKLLLHHVAESSVKAFVDRIASAVEEVAMAGGGGAEA